MKQSLLSTIRLRHFTLCFLTLLMTFSLIAQEEETPVFKAVKANNLKEVKRLVESGADFQTGDMWHVEPVELAVSNYYKRERQAVTDLTMLARKMIFHGSKSCAIMVSQIPKQCWQPVNTDT